MNVSAIVDGLNRHSEFMYLKDEIDRVAKIDKAECGNCNHWMSTHDCPREKGFQKGGPTCGDMACDKFSIKQSAVKFKAEQKTELDIKIAEFEKAI